MSFVAESFVSSICFKTSSYWSNLTQHKKTSELRYTEMRDFSTARVHSQH